MQLFLQHERAKDFDKQLFLFTGLWCGQLVLVQISWDAAAAPAVCVGWGMGSHGLILIAYALWAGAFNSKKSFFTTAGAERTKIQQDLNKIKILFLFMFYSCFLRQPRMEHLLVQCIGGKTQHSKPKKLLSILFFVSRAWQILSILTVGLERCFLISGHSPFCSCQPSSPDYELPLSAASPFFA